ncbi:MAG TPA: phosphoglycerate kinase [Candidatus Saccharimonadales bacterium]|nr:phosphoglycerate kinase [Candidatus Saccharimonadales bacterium]
MKVLEEAAVGGKKVLVRVDLNVPQDENGKITDDFRLMAILPTLNFLLNRGAKVILMAHLGQPKKIDKKYSFKPVYIHLSALLKKPILFAPELFSPRTRQAVDGLESGQVLGLENLRFDPGEDNDSRTFARRLSEYGDIYVNDAFSVCHRQAASMVAIAEFLPAYAGLLLEKEIQVLGSLLKDPAEPFVAIIGGAKIEDKLPAITHLLEKTDRVLVGGGVANNFLLANGVDVKKSLIDKERLSIAKEIIKKAKGKLILPSDCVWKGDIIADIGRRSTDLYLSYIKSAKTVFWNGCLGITEEAAYSASSDRVAKAMAESGATTIVGGGNTIEVIRRLRLENKISFISSGGGASLEFLSGKKLPGIAALD